MGTLRRRFNEALPHFVSTYPRHQPKTESRLQEISQSQEGTNAQLSALAQRLQIIDEHLIDLENSQRRNLDETKSESIRNSVIIEEMITNLSEVSKNTSSLAHQLSQLEKKLEYLNGEQLRELSNHLPQISSEVHALKRTAIDGNALSSIRYQVDASRSILDSQSKILKELLWGEVFNQAIINCEWLQKAAFSPGRWAAGYPFLYALFCTLSKTEPEFILDIGLGESSKMISCYAQRPASVHHTIIEHDHSWIEFFTASNNLASASTITQLDLQIADVNGCNSPVRMYKGFQEALNGKRFDLIVIDGPMGSDANELSRIDVIELLPQALCDSFVILLDDFNREGERRSADLLRKRLVDSEIAFCEGVYSGSKDTLLIASEDYKFLTTQ